MAEGSWSEPLGSCWEKMLGSIGNHCAKAIPIEGFEKKLDPVTLNPLSPKPTPYQRCLGLRRFRAYEA